MKKKAVRVTGTIRSGMTTCLGIWYLTKEVKKND